MSGAMIGWLGFGLSVVVYVATFAIAFGKMMSTGAYMTKELEAIRSDFGEFRGEVNRGLAVLGEKLQGEAIHGVRLSGRVDSMERRVEGLERRAETP